MNPVSKAQTMKGTPKLDLGSRVTDGLPAHSRARSDIGCQLP
jgi:hypothetical protein